MKEIKLSQQGKKRGQFVALIDDEDYDLVNQWVWYMWNSGNMVYAGRKDKSKFILMHRLILNFPTNCHIDHKDRNGLNNQKTNIRVCSNSNNQGNTIGRSSTGFKGVSICKYKNNISYKARIKINGKLIHLGYFKTAEEAAKTYDITAKLHFKEFAKTNF